MKKIFFLFALVIAACRGIAQTETYDIISYTPPKGWKKEVKQSVVVFTYVDQQDKTWCNIAVYKSIGSKGTIEADFDAAWKELVATPHNTSEPPKASEITEVDGWKMKAGGGKFIYNNGNAIALLTALSGYNKTVDILATTNAQRYIETIEKFTEGIDLKTSETPVLQRNISPVKTTTSNYTFVTTNFDDGWVSAVQENWVEVTKASIKVLLHYPNAKADAYQSVLKDEDYIAWDVLVAPRYNSMTNFEWKSVQSWESISFMEADAVENSTRKKVHIVLFKKHYSNGNGRYLEFVTGSKADYENEFGPYHSTEFDWDKTADMQYRNKFAVAPADLIGTWTANDYASLSYYYVSSGGYAGATATSTADQFTFLPGNNYESDHSGASGVVGNQQFSRQVYKGQVIVTNWQITLNNRFKGATDNFNCQFEAIKGGRILILNQIAEGFKSSYTLVRK
jgi:hypothetical protein